MRRVAGVLSPNNCVLTKTSSENSLSAAEAQRKKQQETFEEEEKEIEELDGAVKEFETIAQTCNLVRTRYDRIVVITL